MLIPKPYFIPDIIREVVAKVSEKLTPGFKLLDDGITGVHYEHGHPVEISNILAEKKDSEFVFQKYPLIALLQDFPEKMGVNDAIASEPTLHLIIARSTMPNFRATQRYDYNFKPYLYPAYMEFLHQLGKHKAVATFTPGQIAHTKIDRLFWGVEGQYGNSKNIFLDNLDIIEIKDLKIKLLTNYC